MEPFLADNEGELLFVCIGPHLTLEETVLNVVTLCLFGEDHWNSELLSTNGCKWNTACFRSKHYSDLTDVEDSLEFFCNCCEQGCVDPVVQEPVNLDDVAGKNLTFLHDSVLK